MAEWQKAQPEEHPRLQRGMRYAPDVPELRKDTTAAGVDRFGHLPPTLDLQIAVEGPA